VPSSDAARARGIRLIASLAHAISDKARRHHDIQAGADEDDPAPAASDHRERDQLGEPDRREGVDLENMPDLIEAEFKRVSRRRIGHARIVDENVDASKRPLRRRDDRRNVAFISKIGRCDCHALSRATGALRLLERRFVGRCEKDAMTGAQQCQRHLESDPGLRRSAI